jgi:hypothetical protein
MRCSRICLSLLILFLWSVTPLPTAPSNAIAAQCDGCVGGTPPPILIPEPTPLPPRPSEPRPCPSCPYY